MKEDDELDELSRKELLEKAKKVLDKIDQLPEGFLSAGNQIYGCRHGLTIRLWKSTERPNIEFCLDHLDKETTTSLIKSGKLTDELLFLHDLAHLPFAGHYCFHLGGTDIYIIDRVVVYFDKFFNVFDKGQWEKKENDDTALNWTIQYGYMGDPTKAFYSRLKESKKKD